LTIPFDYIEKCKKIVIWGYSLSEYDSDVNSILAMCDTKVTNELIVINPDPAAFKRAIVLTGIIKQHIMIQ
jgi:hypothetical protein